MSNDGEILSGLSKLVEAHGKDHMCDACIMARKRVEVMERETNATAAEYVKRRNAPIGSISVSDAIKGRT